MFLLKPKNKNLSLKSIKASLKLDEKKDQLNEKFVVDIAMHFFIKLRLSAFISFTVIFFDILLVFVSFLQTCYDICFFRILSL